MKILHVSFHKGCINNLNYVCNKLNFECHVLSCVKEWNTNQNIIPIREEDNQHYNMTQEMANKYWNIYKDYFNEFDLIITSDTAPLSRIFLQNKWNKKLIIWICNRFNYSHGLCNNFPDNAYYNLINMALSNSKVYIIPNTHFEKIYCCKFNIILKEEVIKPIGLNISDIIHEETTILDDKINTFFIPSYHNENIMCNLNDILNSLEIKNYNKRFKSFKDLQEFKGVICIPYAYSTILLFEMLSLSIIVFIPSIMLLLNMSLNKNLNFWHQNKDDLYKNIETSEWYNTVHKELFIYFDSFEDLKYKINNLNYQEHKLKLYNYRKKHENTVLNQWKHLLN